MKKLIGPDIEILGRDFYNESRRTIIKTLSVLSMHFAIDAGAGNKEELSIWLDDIVK